MRYMRKLLTVAIMAIAALAMTASMASAQGVEISHEEPTGDVHCSTPVTLVDHHAVGGCLTHATSVGDINLEAFGALASACENEYDARVGEDGEGYIYEQFLGGPNCSTPPCEEPDGHTIPWHIEVYERGPDDFALEARFCVESGTLGTVNCHVDGVDVLVDGHIAAFELNQDFCENDPWTFVHVTGSYTLEANDLEIAHDSQ